MPIYIYTYIYDLIIVLDNLFLAIFYRFIQNLPFKFCGKVGNMSRNRFHIGRYLRKCSHAYVDGAVDDPTFHCI